MSFIHDNRSEISGNTGQLSFTLRKCVDPRVDTEELASMDREYIGYVGAQSWNRYCHESVVNTDTEIKWGTLTSPGQNAMWDMKWWIEYDVEININNIPIVQGSTYPFNSSDPIMMFRPYPLHQATNSIQLKINNREIQCYPIETLNARMEYWPQDKLKLSCGCCPHRKFNGQTFADCRIRKGNAGMTGMQEFTDQDYPNSSLIKIKKCEYKTLSDIDNYSKFNRFYPERGYRIEADKAAAVYKIKDANGADDLTNEQLAIFGYTLAQRMYSKRVSQLPNKQIAFSERQALKKEIIDSTEYKNLLKNKHAQRVQPANPMFAAETELTSETLLKGEFLDADLIPETLVDYFVAAGIIGASKTIYNFGSIVGKKNFTLIATIREPVICEPLDFTSSADFGRTMWNIDRVELKYTLNNCLTNMLAFNEYLLLEQDWYWTFRQLNPQKEFLSDDNIRVKIQDFPRLIYNIATPFTAPRCPFVCQHKQFQRYESYLPNTTDLSINKDSIGNYINPNGNDAKIRKVTSQIYNLTFHPNSIYIWVGQRATDRYSGKDKFTRVDSYAKINRISITYGNTPNILANFDDHELFQMSLRNGLQDRSFLDWNATTKSITTPTDYYQNSVLYGTPQHYTEIGSDTGFVKGYSTKKEDSLVYNRYAGIGSVVRLIPGIDILTGDATSPIIAGMNAFSQGIQFNVEFTPLNVYETTNYSLFIMFEHDGVCTIGQNTCDLGMIAIDSWAKLKATPKARTMREVYAYGAGLRGGCDRVSQMANVTAKQLGIKKAGSGGVINSVGNLGRVLGSGNSGGTKFPPEKLLRSSNFTDGGGSFYSY